MDEVYSNPGNKSFDETPRKKIKFSLTSAESTTKGEKFVENKSKNFPTKSKTVESTSGKFSMDISTECEKLLDDSGINLEFTKENEDESFEIRRIRGDLRPCQGVEGSEGETPNRKSCDSEGRQSQFRGETQEVNENCLPVIAEMDATEERITKNEDVIKKTPDRSLFKKVQEKLLYECNLTPKKPKKKFLTLNMTKT